MMLLKATTVIATVPIQIANLLYVQKTLGKFVYIILHMHTGTNVKEHMNPSYTYLPKRFYKKLEE